MRETEQQRIDKLLELAVRAAQRIIAERDTEVAAQQLTTRHLRDQVCELQQQLLARPASTWERFWQWIAR